MNKSTCIFCAFYDIAPESRIAFPDNILRECMRFTPHISNQKVKNRNLNQQMIEIVIRKKEEQEIIIPGIDKMSKPYFVVPASFGCNEFMGLNKDLQ